MKRKSKLFAALILTLLLMLVTGIPVSAAASPGTVKLTKITATDYNKINVKWKKTSGATNYVVYYKKSGTSKWIKVKMLDNTKSSYTHTSSSKYPIVVGQKYQYTVKAYNSKTKKYGAYNTKGLTVNTIPQTVKLISAKLNDDGSVTISWNKAGGADKYYVYTKNDSNWSQIGSSTNLTFIDKTPVKGQYNIYTVKGLSQNGVSGKYDNYGVREYVSYYAGDDDDDNEPTVTPTPSLSEEQFASEIFRLTNVERTKYGEPLVQYNEDLHKAAMQRAKEISVKFSHTRPDGTSGGSILGEYGLPEYNSGENIATGYSSPQATVDGWMASQGHRVALLNSYSTHLGVGVYKSGDIYYCVQLFTSFGAKEKLTIDANGGYFPTLNNVSIYDMYFYHNTHIKFARDLPVPVREGFTFVCWEDNAGCRYSGIRTYEGVKLHAIWKEN